MNISKPPFNWVIHQAVLGNAYKIRSNISMNQAIEQAKKLKTMPPNEISEPCCYYSSAVPET